MRQHFPFVKDNHNVHYMLFRVGMTTGTLKIIITSINMEVITLTMGL